MQKWNQLFILIWIFFSSLIPSFAQEIGIFNQQQKQIFKIKPGKNLDFRIDYNKIYPERSDSILESRMFGLVDSINGENIFLKENVIVLNFTKTETILVEQEYEYTDLKLNLDDIKSISFTPKMASIGNALLTIGMATLIASPLLGITPDGYSTDRFIRIAAIGTGTAIIGGGISMYFKQKPVKFKNFDGPEYYKKYQPGSISVLQQ